MKKIAVYEAKTRLSELLDAVEAGGEFLITRRGTPVARLIAAEPSPPPFLRQAPSQHQRVNGAIKALAELRRGVSLDMPLRQAIESGRD